MTFHELEAIMAESAIYTPSDYLRGKRDEGAQNIYYQFFGLYAASIKEPGVFLEIGVQRGGLAHHIVEMAPQHKYVGIDINGVAYFPHDKAILLHGDSTNPDIRDVVKGIADTCGGILGVFQDSSHHYLPSVKEWEMYSPLVRPGGVWFCDDITEAFKTPNDLKSMVGYFDDLPGEKRKYEHLHHGSVIGVVLL